MTKPTKSIAYVILFLAVVAGTLYLLQQRSASDQLEAARAQQNSRATPTPAAARGEMPSHGSGPARTLAEAWDLEAGSQAGNIVGEAGAEERPLATDIDEEHPFYLATVYEALGHVRLDEDGALILDADALGALNSYFNEMATELTVTEISQLQAIIRASLPDATGIETAEIIGNYYNYLLAEQEFMQNAGEVEDMATIRSNYDQLVSLRKNTMGEDVATRLFRLEQAFAYYTMDVMSLMQDPDLSDEERIRLQAELYENLPPELKEEEEEIISN